MTFHWHDSLLGYDKQSVHHQSLLTRRLFRSPKDGFKQVCLSGNRGSGKTVALLMYALWNMVRTPGLRVTWARSEYATIKTTVIDTLQYQVFKYPLGDSRGSHPLNPFVLKGGVDRPDSLVLWNSSRMRFIGLDKVSKTRGAEADLFILNEGTREETMSAWSEAGATMAGGRAGRWFVNGKRFNQLVTDTNPSSPYHWIYQLFRAENPDDSDVGLYEFDDRLWLGYHHGDNPLHSDGQGGINLLGQEKVDDLLLFYPSGFDQQRMVHSQWAASEGVVYSMFNTTQHVKPMSVGELAGARWHIGIDHGGGPSPFAVGLFAQVDDTFHLFKELIMSRCTIDDVIARLDERLTRWGVAKSQIETVWPDTAVPSFNMSLREAGYPVMNEVDKDIEGGIDSVKQIIGDNRFFVNATSLEDRCPVYDGPQGTKEEMLSYAYAPKERQFTMSKPDHPVDRNDHFMDLMRYLLHGTRDNVLPDRETGFIAKFSQKRW